MSILDWAGLALTFTSLFSAFALMIRWMVKSYLAELKPNGGSSMKDSINRLESRIDDIFVLIAENNKK